MTKTEVIHFLGKIKAYYQNFCKDSYVVDEWYDRLKNYNIDDVYRKLDEHLQGEYRNEIPKLHYITRYLSVEKERREYNTADKYVRCVNCNKLVKLIEFDKHVDRCNSVDYLCRMSQKHFNKRLDAQKLMEVEEERFEKYYWDFCDRLYGVMPDGLQKHVLKNAILTHVGRDPEYDLETIAKEFA